MKINFVIIINLVFTTYVCKNRTFFNPKEVTTKSFILRVDAEMMEAIEAWAVDEFRSTNGQIQYILDQALRKAGRLKKKRILKSEE